MNDRQRDYFRAKLLAWKDEILRELKITLQALQEENVNHPDLADRASSETDRAIELRARDRQRKLISKIDAALQRIEDDTYGYCEETGEPISLKRLEARPIATLSVEAQERHEKRERSIGTVKASSSSDGELAFMLVTFIVIAVLVLRMFGSRFLCWYLKSIRGYKSCCSYNDAARPSAVARLSAPVCLSVPGRPRSPCEGVASRFLKFPRHAAAPGSHLGLKFPNRDRLRKTRSFRALLLLG